MEFGLQLEINSHDEVGVALPAVGTISGLSAFISAIWALENAEQFHLASSCIQPVPKAGGLVWSRFLVWR